MGRDDKIKKGFICSGCALECKKQVGFDKIDGLYNMFIGIVSSDAVSPTCP
jgi:hypothetical protein